MLVAPLDRLRSSAAIWFVPMVAPPRDRPTVRRRRLARAGPRRERRSRCWRDALNPPNLAFTDRPGRHRHGRATRAAGTSSPGSRSACFGLAVVDRWMVIPLRGPRRARRRRGPRAPAAAAVGRTARGRGGHRGHGVVLAPPERDADRRGARDDGVGLNGDPARRDFAVIGYPADRGLVEWFPALSGRENLTTWQGTECIRMGIGVTRHLGGPIVGPCPACHVRTTTSCAQVAAPISPERSVAFATMSTFPRNEAGRTPTSHGSSGPWVDRQRAGILRTPVVPVVNRRRFCSMRVFVHGR